MNVLLDTNMLSEPLRELPDPVVMAQLESEEHVLHTASVVIHELSYGIHRLPSGRKQQRLNSYLQGLLRSGLTVLPYEAKAALWHGEHGANLPRHDALEIELDVLNHLVLITQCQMPQVFG